MRRNTYIGIALVVLVFGVLFIPKIFQRLANDDVSRGGRMHKVGGNLAAEDEKGLAYNTKNDKERKVPSFEFINQNGDTITNKSYLGKVYLVEFFFSRCTNICIPMNHNLQEIASRFEGNPNFGIASFSIDPEHDTPEVLKKYAADYGVTNPNWHFLTGDKQEIYQLSNEGFNLLASEEPALETMFYHSGYFALVDQNGFLRSRRDAYGNPISYYQGAIPSGATDTAGEAPQINELIEDIEKLLE